MKKHFLKASSATLLNTQKKLREHAVKVLGIFNWIWTAVKQNRY